MDDDVLAGGRGPDDLRGGGGEDVGEFVFRYGRTDTTSVTTSTTVDLSKGWAKGSLGHDSLGSIEDAWTGAGSDVLIGDAQDNTFYVGAASERQLDSVRGRRGSDILTFDPAAVEDLCCSGLNLDLTMGVGRWGEDRLTVSSVENVIGTSDPDRITGNAESNLFQGESGDDVIDGGAGDDELLGGSSSQSGNDVLYGRSGDDRLYGGAGRDRLYGGRGKNEGDGGHGFDYCVRPDRLHGAQDCEA
jgi:Ca2+-binding RTX toxin-like protein